MVIATLTRISVDSVFTTCVKNWICFYALENVRKSLQQTITELTLPKLGSFAAKVVGTQLGTIAAIPVTMLIGELFASAFKRVIITARDLFRAIVFGEKNSITTPFIRDAIFTVASFALGFFVKTYFSNHAMPYVGKFFMTAVTIGTPLLGAPLAVALVAPALIAAATPTLTLMIGEFLGTATSILCFKTLDFTWNKLFKPAPMQHHATPPPQPTKQAPRSSGGLLP